MADRALVQNASDPRQVRNAARIEERLVREQLAHLRATLSTYEGRATVWAFISSCKVYGSIYSQSSAIYYNAGKQDVGHEWLAKCVAVDERLYEQMEREARQRARGLDASIDAAHTASAAEGDQAP